MRIGNRNANIQITPKSFELMVTGTGADSLLGVRFNVHQGYANVLDSFTFPIDAHDARLLGHMLIEGAKRITEQNGAAWQ